MLVYLLLVIMTMLACYPKGRVILKYVFSYIFSIIFDHQEARDARPRYDFENDGPHYDYHSAEIHAFKENGGMYDEKH